MIKKVALLILIIFYIAMLTSCNTLHGFGKDLESVGEAIEKTTD